MRKARATLEQILREYLELATERTPEPPIGVRLERWQDGTRLVADIPIPESLLKNLWEEKEL